MKRTNTKKYHYQAVLIPTDATPVNIRSLASIKESISVVAPTTGAIKYIRDNTIATKNDYRIVVAGRRFSDHIDMGYFSMGKGMSSSSAHFTAAQNRFAREHVKISNGEIMYGCSHANCDTFTGSDLHFIKVRALELKRDIYGVYIGKERNDYVKYDYNKREFFQLKTIF